MNDKSRQNGRPKPEEDFSEFGKVRVISRPAPDAEDRLRRLFTLLLRSPTGDGQATSASESRVNDAPAEHEAQADADA